MELRTADFDYELPEELIAQEPPPRRGDSRLLVVERATGRLIHDTFSSLPSYLTVSDLLVANRSRVIPARLAARKETGGQVEILLLQRLRDGEWRALARPSRRLDAGMKLILAGTEIEAMLTARLGDGEWEIRFKGDGDVDRQVLSAGEMPLPPYIHAPPADRDRYQTVYADRDGSVAAPTAGLHFSEEMLASLESGGTQMRYVTLHVGLGTFRPVSVDRVVDHQMHAEWGEVPEDTAMACNEARARDGRVVAVGTTTTRILESACESGEVRPFRGETGRFIYPGYRFCAIDALITNFHLPRSTLLMLVSALAGRDLVLRAYREAVLERYRFFSFGDAMLVL